MKKRKIVPFVICLFIPLLVGVISGFLTQKAVNGDWFSFLQKPWFNPPNYLFAPVWTTLYILMGISLFYIRESPASELRKKALTIFSAQLLLNFLWSILFFSCHALLFSVIDIILLWIMIIAMIVTFKKIKPAAAYLQIPYLLWVSFATALDASIWYMNT